MNYPHIASRIFNTPLLISPAKLDAILVGLSERLGVEYTPATEAAPEEQAFVAASGERRQPGYSVTNGVAVLQNFGVLVHRGGLQPDSTYLLGYQEIAKRFDAAMADPEVNAILMVMDSPGGEVSGAFDLAEKVMESRGRKPIYAVADGLATSAGYLIAAGADKFFATRQSLVGSIGVVMRHVDMSQYFRREGVQVTHIFAGSHKVDGNPYEPLPEPVREQFQAQIDEVYTDFVEFVANARGLKPAAVRSTEAGIFRATMAADIGLLDGLATPDELISMLGRSGAVQVSKQRASAARGQQEVMQMGNEKETAPAGNTKPEMSVEDLRQQYPEQIAAIESSAASKVSAETETAVAEARAEGATMERERIKSIMVSESVVGREGMANHLAFETSMAAEDALKLLEAAPAASVKPVNQLAQAMQNVTNPDVGPDGGEPDDDVAAASKAVAAARAAGLVS